MMAAERTTGSEAFRRRVIGWTRKLRGAGGVCGVALLVVLLAVLPAALPARAAALEPDIQIGDVALFYQVYDAAHGHPGADQIQRDYLDHASDGMHRLLKERPVTAARIAAAIATNPDMYTGARRCMVLLPAVKRRMSAALGKLADLYPQIHLQPIDIVVGRGRPTGITDDKGVIIDLVSLCAVKWMDPDLEDRFVHGIAHEFGHVQQVYAAPAIYDKDKPTVLEASIVEGAAEFTAELVSGGTSEIGTPAFRAMLDGQETRIETRFVPDEDKTDLSAWMYNGSLEKPGDLGYWVGYRIVKSYFEHASDKRKALAQIFAMTDAHAFLKESGWYPGMVLK